MVKKLAIFEHSGKIKTMIKQESILSLTLPMLKMKGRRYRKFKKISARMAQEGEKIATITSDGIETINQAKKGDYIVKNKTEAGEMYIVPKKKFEERYELIEKKENGFSEYNSNGRILAIEMNRENLEFLKQPNEFKFIAPWGASMVVKENDYLAVPLDYSEKYRIARKEFFETYQLED